MTVAQRLYLLVFSAALGLLVLVGLGQYQMGKVYDAANFGNDHGMPALTNQAFANDALTTSLLLMGRHVLSTDVAVMADIEKDIAENRAKAEKSLNDYVALAVNEEDKKILEEEKAGKTEIFAHIDQVLVLSRANKKVEAIDLLMKNREKMDKVGDSFDVSGEFNSKLSKKSSDGAASLKTTSIQLFILIAALVLAAVCVMGWLIVRNLTRALSQATKVVNKLSDGDLTVKIEVNSNDEVGMLLVAMQNMVGKLKAMITEVSTSADQVASTATQLSASSSQVASGSQQQSESASSMASAIEEMTVSIDQVSENAQKARDASRHSGEMSAQGTEVIQNAAAEMAKIEGSVQQFSQIIESLERQSGEISAIVNVIKEIADQTNLLALNAAIEAARAGEQGRGFAVVADEVRKLAERTGISTQEIATMIGKIQSGTRSAVASIESGVAQVSSGVALANQAGQSITGINAEAALVAQVIEDISDSLREQSIANVGGKQCGSSTILQCC